MSDLKLGRGGKMGSVNAEQIKGGLKKEQIKDKNLQTIFDNVDVNKDGILDADEIQKFQEQINNAAGDDKLSNKEAKKYLKEHNMKNIDKKDLFKFINELSQGSENIKSSTVTENNGKKTITITYKDGTTETINPDKSKEVATQGENGETIADYYDANGKKTGKKVTYPNGEIEETKYQDGNKKEVKTTGEGGKPVVTTQYEGDKPVSSELKEDLMVESYTYDENETPILNKKVENKGLPNETVTEYEYNEDGTVTANVTSQDGTKTTQTIKDKQVVKEIINKNGTITERTYNEDGYTDVTDDGATTTTFNKENKKLSQTKTVDGKTYSVEYDGEGNTKGIIVQNGESIAVLAKKFGCTPEDIINANPDAVKGKGDKAYFLVGDEIKIPKELEADDKALQGRTSREDAINGYNDYMAKKAAEEAAKKAEQEAAAQAEKDAAEAAKEKEHRAEMQKQGKDIANSLYEDMKGIGTSKTFDENIKKINKDNVVEVIQGYTEKSPNESIAEAILDETGMNLNKRKEAITHIYNELIARAEEKGIDTAQAKKEFEEAIKNHNNATFNNEDFDAIFNTLCAAINGKSVLTKAEKEEIKNTAPETLQQNTTQLLQDTAEGAEKSLNDQLAKDGWAADLWEGMKWCVDSDNLDEKVKADIDAYKKQVAELNTAKTPEEFKAKFKEIYGVDYDPELVKAYQKRQEQLPLAEATHGVEENFNKEMAHLLASDKLAAKTQYTQTSSFGTGTYQEIASKEEVFNDEMNKFAEFIGQGDKEAGLKDIEQAFKDAGLPENASMDEKYKVLHKIAKNYSEILHANTLEATEGKGYDAFKLEAESAYKAAFGLKNDIAKRVADYNTSQQTGDMIVKGIVKGGAAIGLALIPGVGLAAAAIGTGIISATVDVSDRMSSDVGLQEGELTTILKNASIDGATVFAGGQLTKMLANAKTFVKIGGQLTGDVAVGAAAEKLQTGQISLNGVLFQCVFSAAGNLVAIKNMGKAPKDVPDVKALPAHETPQMKALPPHETPTPVKTPPAGDPPKTPKATPQTDAPTLDVASSNGNATPGSVKVGEKKANAIREEVDNVVNNPNSSGEDLAQIRHEAEGIQNRDVRREVEQKIDNAAENLTPEQKAAFDAAKKANAQKNVDHIFEKHSELNSADTRVLNEYINNTDDIAVLNELKDKLYKKEHSYGGVTANYDRLRKAIDDKLTSLQPKAVKTNAQQREDVVGMLNEKAQSGKGLNGDDFKQINEYIATIDNEADLNEIKGLLGGKKMTSAQKKQLKEALAAKTEEIKNQAPAAEPPKADEPAPAPKAEEPVAEPPKADEPAPAPKADEPVAEPPKADEPAPAPKADEPEVHYPTPEERMAMGQIGSNINAAKSLKDIEKAQAWLDKIPDCEQKSVLQNQLNAKSETIRNAQSPDVNVRPETTPDKILKKGDVSVVAKDAKLELGKNGYELDMQSPEIKARLSKMKDGESLTIGREAPDSKADIQLKQADDTVSREHIRITKKGDNFVIEDLSTNGSIVNPTPKARPIVEAAPPKMSPIEQSNKFADTSRVEVGEKIADGYRDGGRRRHFDSNGKIESASREVVVVNRQQDKKLQAMLKDVKSKTANMTEKQKAQYLQDYIHELTGDGNITVHNCEKWDAKHVGQDVLLGDIITHKPPIAVCRHRSLLYKVLGDEIGLKVELQRGNFYSSNGHGGGHAWNTVRFEDGSSAIFDAMHNRSSSTTPGMVDNYAKQYYTVDNDPLYNNGLKNEAASPDKRGNNVHEAKQFKMEPNRPYPLEADVKQINMSGYNLDLSNPKIKKMLDKLPEGGQITIGREGNIKIPEKYNGVSRIHVTIIKRDGKLYIVDNSKNGTSLVA